MAGCLVVHRGLLVRPSRLSYAARREDGFALVVALVITLLVFTITTAILADAFHNVVGSANSRSRTTAISAAESGIASYARSLESFGLVGLDALRSGTWSGSVNTFTQTAVTVPGDPVDATFSLTATYGSAYNATSDVVSCPSPCTPFASLTPVEGTRIWAEVVSVGQVAGESRSVRAVFELEPTFAVAAGAFSGIYICQLGNSFRVSGPDADMYVLGTDGVKTLCDGSQSSPYAAFQVSSGRFETSGSVFVLNGSAYMVRTTKIDGDLWAKTALTLGEGGAALPGFGVCSSTNSAQELVCGDATSIDSAPIVHGPRGKVLGLTQQCAACLLPSITFPHITTTQALAMFPTSSSWPATPATTLPDLTVPSGSKQLVHLPCPTPAARTSMPKKNIVLQSDLAIVSDCGFAFLRGLTVTSASASTRPKLYLMTGWTESCAADDQKDIVFRQNFDSTAVDLFLYTGCKVSFRNQTNITGQVLAGGLSAQGNTSLVAKTLVSLDGSSVGVVVGFLARTLSLREI